MASVATIRPTIQTIQMMRLQLLQMFSSTISNLAICLALCVGQASAQQRTTPGTAPADGSMAPSSQGTPPPALSAPPAGAPGVIHPPVTSAPMQPDRRQAKAKTPEEAAAYQKIISEKSPDTQISQIEEFLLQYPDSEMREYVFEVAMEAYHAKSEYNHMQTYGELTLAQNPDNLTALLELSSSLAETTGQQDPDRDDKLDDGDEHAAHALDVLEQLHKPPGFPDEQWDRIKKDAMSIAHASRGLIALVRQDFSGAVTEMKQAVDLTLRPRAVLLYRLGLAYSFQQKYTEALETLDRAAAMGGVKFNSGGKVRDLVAEAKEMASKGLASAATPAGSPDATSNGTVSGSAPPAGSGTPAGGQGAPAAAPQRASPDSSQPGGHPSGQHGTVPNRVP